MARPCREHVAFFAGATVLLASALLLTGCGKNATGVSGNPSASGSPRDLLAIGDVGKNEDGEVVTLDLFGAAVTDDELQQLVELEYLRQLSLQECPGITDEGLTVLRESKDLRSLSLINVPISDDGLACLENSTSLQELLLGNTAVEGGGLAYLSGTPLSRLTIHSRVATVDGMASLATLTSLREIDLNCRHLEVSDLPSLTKLAHLESFVAIRTPAGAVALEKFRDHPTLRRLVLLGEGLDDGSLPVLNTLDALEELELNLAGITNAGLEQLEMPNLRKLSLAGCPGVTDAGLDKLGGLTGLIELNLTEAGVGGRDLTGLKVVPTLQKVILSGEQFRGDESSIEALHEFLPDCEVVILRG